MTRALAREGMVMNHKRVRRLMRELDIQFIIRKTSILWKKNICDI